MPGSAGLFELAFNPRYRGESGGESRDYDSPLAKVADVRAAVDYLLARADIDAAGIATLAICQDISEMLRAAADNERIKALATVAGHHRDHEGDVQWLGSEQALAERRARGERAKASFEQTGEVDYDRRSTLPAPRWECLVSLCRIGTTAGSTAASTRIAMP